MHKDGLLGRGEKIKYLLNIGKVNIDFPTFVTRLSGDSNRDTDTMSRENAKITVSVSTTSLADETERRKQM